MFKIPNPYTEYSFNSQQLLSLITIISLQRIPIFAFYGHQLY